MKKNLLKIVGAAAAAILPALFAACSGGDSETIVPAHEHTFYSDWSSDSEYHWHGASCVHSDLRSDMATHSWDEGRVTVPAQGNDDGEKTFTCKVCGKTETSVIENPNHVHTFSEAWKSDENYHWHESNCKHTGIKSTIMSHEWNAGTVLVAPTTEKTGTMVYSCNACGRTKQETIPVVVENYVWLWTKMDTTMETQYVSYQSRSVADWKYHDGASDYQYVSSSTTVSSGTQQTSQTVMTGKTDGMVQETTSTSNSGTSSTTLTAEFFKELLPVAITKKQTQTISYGGSTTTYEYEYELSLEQTTSEYKIYKTWQKTADSSKNYTLYKIADGVMLENSIYSNGELSSKTVNEASGNPILNEIGLTNSKTYDKDGLTSGMQSYTVKSQTDDTVVIELDQGGDMQTEYVYKKFKVPFVNTSN